MNKSVLITGSSRGIGKATALALAADGYDVVVHCRSKVTEAQAVSEAAQKLGVKSRVLQFDISQRAVCAEILLKDIEAHGCYYGVVLNAGLTRDGAFPALSDEDWDDVLRSNLDGFYNVLKPLTMPMIHRKAPGRIVTLSSVSGLVGNRGQVNYSAAKGGIIAATKALAMELAKRQITVNCVAPGVIETDMTLGLSEEELKAMIPLRRFGKPEEVASLIRYLMSDGAAYITRQVISVNGGLSA
jgi:3-oxoacyl-[acyl-carrier protein] reductase